MGDYFLQSARLGLRHWRAADLPLALELWLDPAVTRFITAHSYTESEVRQRLAREMETEAAAGIQYWPLFLRDGDGFVGCCGLRPRAREPGIAEFGVHLLPRCWKHGYAREAADEVIRHAFDALGYQALFAGHHPENAASRALLLRLGFVHTHDELYPPTGLLHPAYRLARHDARRLHPEPHWHAREPGTPGREGQGDADHDQADAAGSRRLAAGGWTSALAPAMQTIKDLGILLARMRPELHAGRYAFVALPPGARLAPADIVASIREAEGLSIIVAEETARDLGLPVAFVAAWITLTVHSDLAAVGLTAAFARTLGDAGISCNVVAGVHHDHVFVPVECARQAMDALTAMALQAMAGNRP